MVRIALVFLLLCCSQALAGKNDATWNPPPEFDHPYKGKLETRYLPQPEVFKECSRMMLENNGSTKGAYPEMRGCSTQFKNYTSCIIILIEKPVAVANKPGVTITPEAVLRHEIGHCNGWNH